CLAYSFSGSLWSDVPSGSPALGSRALSKRSPVRLVHRARPIYRPLFLRWKRKVRLPPHCRHGEPAREHCSPSSQPDPAAPGEGGVEEFNISKAGLVEQVGVGLGFSRSR